MKGLVSNNTNVQYESLIFESYGQGLSFCSGTHADVYANTDTRAMTLAPKTLLPAH